MNTSKGLILFAGLALCTAWAAPARAGSPTLELGLTAWNAQASGEGTSTAGGNNNSTVDLRSDLGMERQWSGGAHFIFRPDVPLVPNLLLATDHVFGDGNATLDRNITWQGKTFQANGPVQSQVDLQMQRIEAFWNPLDNTLVTLRLGLDVRHLKLHLPVTGTVNGLTGPQKESASAGGSAWLPLGNVGLAFHLPGGLDLSGEWSYVRYSGSYLSDYRAQVTYNFDWGLQLYAGWRRFHLRLDTSSYSVKGNLNFEGVYTGIGYAF